MKNEKREFESIYNWKCCSKDHYNIPQNNNKNTQLKWRPERKYILLNSKPFTPGFVGANTGGGGIRNMPFRTWNPKCSIHSAPCRGRYVYKGLGRYSLDLGGNIRNTTGLWDYQLGYYTIMCRCTRWEREWIVCNETININIWVNNHPIIKI